jgi:4-amino-4-deoxy-L-arabinose transferase-like glycosyltransferase
MNNISTIWPKIREHPYEVLVLALYLVFLGYFFVGINNPLDYRHHGYVLGQKAHYAINYLKFGFIGTRLGQLEASNKVLESGRIRYAYYVHHPVLISVLVALSFKLFGVYEWSARLVTLPLNTLLIACMYLFVKTYWDKRTAVYSVFFLVFSPMLFALKNFVSWESSTLPFIMLTLYMYVSWLKSKVKLRYLLLSFLVGTLSDWQIYFIVPPIIIHYMLFAGVKRGWKLLILIPVALLGFVVFLAHVWLLTGTPWGSEQSDYKGSLMQRTNIDSDFNIRSMRMLRRVHNRIIKWGRHYYTPLMYYSPLALAIAMILKVLASGRLDSIGRDSLPLLVYLSYVAYLFTFSNLTYFHDFYVLSLLSSLPVTTSICIGYLSRLLRYMSLQAQSRFSILSHRVLQQKVLPLMQPALLTSVFACFIVQAIPSYAVIYEIYDMDNADPLFTLLSKAPGENLIVEFTQNIGRPEIRFYSDRVTVRYIHGLGRLNRVLRSEKDLNYRFILLNEKRINDSILAELKGMYWHDEMRIGFWGGSNVTVFDLRNKTSY